MITKFPDGTDALVYADNNISVLCGYYNEKTVLVQISFETIDVNKEFRTKSDGIKYAEQMIKMLQGIKIVAT